MFHPRLILAASLSAATALHGANPPPPPPEQIRNEVIVSVKEQKLMLLQNGAKVTTYPVSTSKFGLGDGYGTMATPVGAMAVAQKIGDRAPLGAVFHHRRFTGEVLKPDAPGRDPIITRIIWLRGLEASTARSFARCIYIHGTPQEKLIGKPASYGCIRMKSKDVTDLYSQLPVGAVVQVVTDKLPNVPKAKVVYRIQVPDAPVEKGRPAPFVKSQGSAPAGRDNAASASRRSGGA
ncbi:MAG TPA: L,D-transpeptidase [Chthoniobacterales bacterium]|nr:L,D-transpeptidase [Chthoniobacterales bacterium]